MNRSLLSAENALKTCRICLDNDNPKDFIRPCLCSGGSAYVHRKCLDIWRSSNKDGRAFNFCDVCRFEYVIEPVVYDPSADKKRLLIFRLLVTRDITLIILLVQAIIIGMAFLLQLVDKGSHNIKDLYPASMNSFGVYYLSSLILFFAVLGLFGLIGLCCGMIRNDDDDACDCAGYQCFFCFNMNSNGHHGNHSCGDCNGNNNCSGDSGGGGGAAAILIIIIVIFAIIGVVFGVILSVMIIRKIIKRHTKKLWLRQETKKYIVKDFEGRINELRNISTRRPVTNSLIHNETNNDRTRIAPSAPVQLLSDNDVKYIVN